MDSYEKVLDFFSKADKPVSAGEVAAATGVDIKDLHNIKKKKKKE